jgi:uncharacterized protein
MDHEEIARLNCEYGGDWAVNHSLRLVHLVSILGAGLDYDKEAIWLAAQLHDWGAYPKWVKPGVEHYDRSAEVAREFLEERDCPEKMKNLVIEIVHNHHGGKPERSIESKLFTDADALDLLGVVGTLRVFSMVPRDLKGAMSLTRKYRAMSVAAITLPQSQELAATRIAETDELLAKFEDEAFGIY